MLPSSVVPVSAGSAGSELLPAVASVGAAGAAVSIVRLNALVGVEVLPATSVSVAVSAWPPSMSVGAVIDHAPLLTVAEPIAVAPSCSVTVSPLTPVPVSTGAAWLVMPSPSAPLSLPAASAGMDGADGARVSMVRLNALVGVEVLPATSVSVAVSAWPPSMSVGAVIDHAPLLTVAEPIAMAPSYSVTVSPLLPVPVSTGAAWLVMPSPSAPLSLPAASAGIDGADGARVSIVRLNALVGVEVLPATSVSVAVSAWPPSVSVGAVIDQAPLLTVAEPIAVPPSYSVTVSPLLPVPVSTGAAWLVMPSPSAPLSLPAVSAGIDGASGMAVSIVMLRAVEAGDTLPATSVSCAVSAWPPSLSTLVVMDHWPPLTTPLPTEVPPS